MSAMGVPQITAIMGMCVAGGAYLPVMCDHILMTEGSGLFLAGPALVQAAIGMKYSPEELGGAQMHAQISGTVDYREPNDESCIARIRSLVEKMGARPASPFSRIAAEAPRLPKEQSVDDLRGLDQLREHPPLGPRQLREVRDNVGRRKPRRHILQLQRVGHRDLLRVGRVRQERAGRT